MKCIYFAESAIKTRNSKKETITALVAEEESRPVYKDSINALFEKCFGADYKTYPVYWEDIDADNLDVYEYVIYLFNNNPNMVLHTVTLKDGGMKKKRKAYADLIEEIGILYDDKIKVFIPANEKYGRKNIRLLGEALKTKKINCVISQNPLEESRFYQTAKLFCDMFAYYEDELGYFDHIEEPGQPELVSYYLGLKKPKNKYNQKKNS